MDLQALHFLKDGGLGETALHHRELLSRLILLSLMQLNIDDEKLTFSLLFAYLLRDHEEGDLGF